MKIVKKLCKDKTLLYLTLVLALYTVLFLVLRYLRFDYNNTFGYLDHQLYWESLHRLLDGQVFYRDFFWEYGPLYLLYSLPVFVLLGKTFWGYVFIRLIFLPITGFVLAYFLGKTLLKGKWLVLFLLVSVLYSTLNFETIRHIIAELGLLLLVLGIFKEQNKRLLFGSVLLGISLMAGIEYAAVALISLTVFISWTIYHKGKKAHHGILMKAYIGSVLFGALFFGFLYVFGALENYMSFFKEFSSSFFYLSPCRSGFPRLNQAIFSSLKDFRRLNLWAMPLILVTLSAYVFIKRKALKLAPVLLVILLFSGLAYVRTMINPCLNTLAYSVTLPILVLIYFLQRVDTKRIKIVMYLVLIWLILMAAPNGITDLAELLRTKDQIRTQHLEVADIELDEEKVRQIEPVVTFIKENTKPGDYVYVYPYGPYNQLTDTRSPVRVIISTHYELAPFLIPKVIQDLEDKKPEYIIINRVNAWSYLAAMYIIPQSLAQHDDVPVFTADLTEVERYISQNYAVYEKFDQVWVLRRRENPVEYIPPYVPADVEILRTENTNYHAVPSFEGSMKFYITGPNPEMIYFTRSLADVNLVKFPVKGNYGLFKYTSQYLIQAYLFTLDGSLLDTRADILSDDWQRLWMEVRDDERLQEGGLLILKLSDNRGFFSLGGTPRSIEIGEPEFFSFNPLVVTKDQ